MIAGPDTRGVRHRELVLQPGEIIAVAADEWADTLVVVTSGELELCCRSGRRARFAAGAVLTLAGLPVLTLRSAAAEPLRLHAVTRCPHR